MLIRSILSSVKFSVKFFYKALHFIYQTSIIFNDIFIGGKAEIDFLISLSVEPDSAYVLNYLAYSWIEQGKNIEKSLKVKFPLRNIINDTAGLK